jgi:hypothetical protein
MDVVSNIGTFDLVASIRSSTYKNAVNAPTIETQPCILSDHVLLRAILSLPTHIGHPWFVYVPVATGEHVIVPK